MATLQNHAVKILGGDAEYLLTKRQVCPVCKGEQCVQHPAWKEYWEDPANREQPTTEERDIEWFKANGWWNALEYSDYHGRYMAPSKEILCSECDGNGYIETQIDLRDALRELGVL